MDLYNLVTTRNMIKRIISYCLITLLIGSVSCLNRKFVDGRYELLSVSDTTLNDSSIFVGYIHQIDFPYPFPNDYEIWIENTDYSTISDSIGYYSIKTMPGVYSIKCQQKGNSWERLIVKIKDIEIAKNQKIRIDFYIGYTIE
jgi:hypothetical protein